MLTWTEPLKVERHKKNRKVTADKTLKIGMLAWTEP